MSKYRPGPGGSRTILNISTATQIFSGEGRICRVMVITDPSVNGGVYDMATGGTASITNQLAIIPIAPGNQQAGTVPLDAPVFNGLYIDPGTGGVVSITYDTYN